MIEKAKKDPQRRAAFITIIFLTAAPLITPFSIPLQDLTGEDIIQKVDDLMSTQTAYAKMKMTIET
ncbi:MAG TPA: hypothetical protein VFG01_10520, partial [Acidobacteriota bacterium]|nr:hypothetical protein [Acidobacteriota bacterium]